MVIVKTEQDMLDYRDWYLDERENDYLMASKNITINGLPMMPYMFDAKDDYIPQEER